MTDMLAFTYSRSPIPPKMPQGLRELMEELTREVLRHGPDDVHGFCASHMKKLLEIRDGPRKMRPLTLQEKQARAQKILGYRTELRQRKMDKLNNVEKCDLEGEIVKLPVNTEKYLKEGLELELFDENSKIFERPAFIKQVAGFEDVKKGETHSEQSTEDNKLNVINSKTKKIVEGGKINSDLTVNEDLPNEETIQLTREITQVNTEADIKENEEKCDGISENLVQNKLTEMIDKPENVETIETEHKENAGIVQETESTSIKETIIEATKTVEANMNIEPISEENVPNNFDESNNDSSIITKAETETTILKNIDEPNVTKEHEEPSAAVNVNFQIYNKETFADLYDLKSDAEDNKETLAEEKVETLKKIEDGTKSPDIDEDTKYLKIPDATTYITEKKEKNPESKTTPIVADVEEKNPDSKTTPIVADVEEKNPDSKTTPIVAVVEEKNPDSKTTPIVADVKEKNPDSETTPIVADVEEKNPDSKTTPIVAAVEEKKPESKTTPIVADVEEKNPDLKTTPIVAAVEEKNPDSKTTPIVAAVEEKKSESKTTPIVADVEEKNTDSKTTPIVAAVEEKKPESKTTPIVADVEEKNPDSKTTPIVAAVEEKNPDSKTTPIVADVEEKNPDSKTTPIVADVEEKNPDLKTTPIVAAVEEKNPDSKTTPIVAAVEEKKSESKTTPIVAAVEDIKTDSKTTQNMPEFMSTTEISGNEILTAVQKQTECQKDTLDFGSSNMLDNLSQRKDQDQSLTVGGGSVTDNAEILIIEQKSLDPGIGEETSVHTENIESYVSSSNDDTIHDSLSGDDSQNIGQATMDLETAAITIQKVFRSFLFKSRNSTFDDGASDESTIDKDSIKEDDFLSHNEINKERRTLGLSRMDSVLQTVNEEKSLSLSTDDSSTLSSAATTIQAHVRGFLVRNKLSSEKTTSINSLGNSNPSESTDIPEQEKSKTILNIHIVPESGHYISRDDSLLASMELSMDGSPRTSSNLHPLGYDKSERRKQLKREDAIQSVSPPSNNSGKLSEDVDSVKEMLLTDAEATRPISADTLVNKKDPNVNLESCDTTPTLSVTEDTVKTAIEIKKDESSVIKKGDLDEFDVVTSYQDNTSTGSTDSKLLHSGEFHDVVLPTNVSRNDSVIRGE